MQIIGILFLRRLPPRYGPCRVSYSGYTRPFLPSNILYPPYYGDRLVGRLVYPTYGRVLDPSSSTLPIGEQWWEPPSDWVMTSPRRFLVPRL